MASEVEANRATMPVVCRRRWCFGSRPDFSVLGILLSYALEIDAGLRSLLGFTESRRHGVPRRGSSKERALEQLRDKAAAVTRFFFPIKSMPAEADFDRLNEWSSRHPEIPEYLIEVRKLLVETSYFVVLAKSPLAQGLRQLYRQIIFATGWQESCWRQFIKKVKNQRHVIEYR